MFGRLGLSFAFVVVDSQNTDAIIFKLYLSPHTLPRCFDSLSRLAFRRFESAIAGPYAKDLIGPFGSPQLVDSMSNNYKKPAAEVTGKFVSMRSALSIRIDCLSLSIGSNPLPAKK
jgi:hypothetical protein